MVGPPGSGKSMLAARLSSILPPLSPAELLDVSMVHSIAGQLSGGKLTDQRPFRAPHHSATMAAMVGGGVKAKPGEVSMAHKGVLFLDEFPEFSPQVLDSLRQPLETSNCIIARANHRVNYPADIQLIAAMNPCRCGMAGEPGHTCARGHRCKADYQARISGPLLDRIDLRIDVPAEMQIERYRALGHPEVTLNARCPTSEIEHVAKMDPEGSALLNEAAQKMLFSARAYHRVLKVARTLADLDHSAIIKRIHLAEAITYRIAGERLMEGA